MEVKGTGNDWAAKTVLMDASRRKVRMMKEKLRQEQKEEEP